MTLILYLNGLLIFNWDCKILGFKTERPFLSYNLESFILESIIYLTAIQEISIGTSNGNFATWTVSLAGGIFLK